VAEGASEFFIDSALNAAFNNTAFQITQAYLQLHTGAPGAAGTSNVATDNTRKTVSFGAPAAPSGGVITISNDAQVQWTNLTAAQDATHYSLWDASSSGNFLGSGAITADAYLIGDKITFAVGDIDISFNCAT
jgi:hypothetical protein